MYDGGDGRGFLEGCGGVGVSGDCGEGSMCDKYKFVSQCLVFFNTLCFQIATNLYLSVHLSTSLLLPIQKHIDVKDSLQFAYFIHLFFFKGTV